ncbi:MAG: hypothetical protein HYZ72_18365 [Deltaproteobacteria bacterium]|nr:hypothetical protein [Deltaproteobacteria bacterium]
MANADNPLKGAKFEDVVREFFLREGLALDSHFSVDVGVSSLRKPRKFDLGCAEPPTLIECKSHTWTEGGNAPSAKLSVWNEAMLYFLAAPTQYRKILAALQHSRGGESLAEHYVKRLPHLVPRGVEIWEVSLDGKFGRCVYTGS